VRAGGGGKGASEPCGPPKILRDVQGSTRIPELREGTWTIGPDRCKEEALRKKLHSTSLFGKSRADPGDLDLGIVEGGSSEPHGALGGGRKGKKEKQKV